MDDPAQHEDEAADADLLKALLSENGALVIDDEVLRAPQRNRTSRISRLRVTLR